MLIDSHCHLDRVDLEPYGGTLSGLLEDIRNHGVGHLLCVSINMEDYPSMVALVAGLPQVSVSVGLHPAETNGREVDEEELVLLAAHPANVAIGETGLDYHWHKGDLEWQRERFRRHIRAAKVAHKPLIIHSRDAREDTIRILREDGAAEVGGVLHCFTEDWGMARAAMDLGFYISFSGIVTFGSATELKEVACKMPLERMLVETDSPYLAPVPLRGKPNQPANVRFVAQYIAELRQVSFESVVEATTSNFQRLFGVP